MNITITSSLTEEQALILAKEKGYQTTIYETTTLEDWTTTSEEIPNPQTIWEFLKNFYQNMVVEDATREFMKYKERTYLAEQRALMEQETRAEVIAWISSTAE